MAVTQIRFNRIGDVFCPGDVLAEWVATLAIAANDLATVGAWIEEPDERARTHPYLFRVVCSHFFEISKYLTLWQGEPAIVAFVAKLDAEGTHSYREVLDTYAALQPTLGKIRDNSAFHYGPTVAASKNPLIRQALRAIADDPGLVVVSGERAWFGFAGEAAAAIFTLSCGGSDPDAGEVERTIREVAGAIIELRRFATAAVTRFVADSGSPTETFASDA